MLAHGPRIGAHLPLGQGLLRATDRAAEIGASAIQVFTDNPTAWRRRTTLPDELPAFRERLAGLDVRPIAVHAPYLVNLATTDPELHARSVAVLEHELRVATAWGAAFVNVHVGSHRGAGPEAGIASLADGLCRVLETVAGEAPDIVVVLENGSGAGAGIGTTIGELARIDAALLAAGVDRGRFAFCLDAAHLWGAGYPIDSPAGVDAVVDEFAARIGLDRLAMVHLNDSRSERGSRTDQHEHLGAGRIGAAGLRRVLTHPGLEHVVYLLETPGMDDGYDLVNMDRARDLVEGRALAELPPDAFDTPSTRGRSGPPEHDDESLDPVG
jgi:deoxyribonuclease-4